MKKSKAKKNINNNKKAKVKGQGIINGSGRDVKHELISLAILVVSVLLIISFLDLGGPVGGAFKSIFYWVFGGMTAWGMVIALTYVSLVPFGREIENKIKRTLILLLFSASFSSMIAAFSLEKGEYGLFDYIGANINVDKLITGGAIGGFFSYVFKWAFSEIGALIIIIALLLTSIILLSKYSIVQMFKGVVGLFRKEADEDEGFAVGRMSRPLRKPAPSTTVSPEKEKKEAAIKFKGFKESAPAGDEEDSGIYGDEHKGIQANDNEDIIPGNISFKMNGNEGNPNGDTVKNPLKDVLNDMTMDSRVPDVLGRTAKERIARNTSYEAKDDDVDVTEMDLTNFNYIFPSYDLLNENKSAGIDVRSAKMQAQTDAKRLESTLKSFGVEARVVNICRGPVVTRYELQPNTGVKINKIVSLSDDLAMNLAAKAIRIEAPIPGKSAIGIEIPNKETQPVFLKDVLASEEFEKAKSKLTVCLGKDITGELMFADISKMPHMLIAGATGSGKSVCINSIIISLLYKAKPQELKMIMIDPKVVELNVYNGIPHLEIPVVTDPRHAAGALQWAVREMENRYRLFAEEGVRDLAGYNKIIEKRNPLGVLPHFVIIVDELADLMMVAPGEIENNVCRLAQMARAAGMHLIIATQRPSVDVITGVIKANIPSRIAFKVSSQFDSRTILDKGGAEKLLGRGDMMFAPMGSNEPVRVQGAFISDGEVERITEFIKKQGNFSYNEEVIEEIENANINTGRKKGSAAYSSNDDGEDRDAGDEDKLLYKAIEIVVNDDKPSASYLQRKLKIGYSRAARIIDQMEEMGIVSGMDGSNSRKVLITKEQHYEMRMRE